MKKFLMGALFLSLVGAGPNSLFAQQPPAANPQPSVATTPIAQAGDGSLANRWQKSPAKP